jgi:hypothetical protein
MLQSRVEGGPSSAKRQNVSREERFGVEPALEYLTAEEFFAFVALAQRDPASTTAFHSFAPEIKRFAAALGEYLDRLPRDPRFRPPREHAEDLRGYARVRRQLEC